MPDGYKKDTGMVPVPTLHASCKDPWLNTQSWLSFLLKLGFNMYSRIMSVSAKFVLNFE